MSNVVQCYVENHAIPDNRQAVSKTETINFILFVYFVTGVHDVVQITKLYNV